MFKNYFKIAWRNFIKDKQFSLLNLLGLSAGLACTVFIFLWVNDEMSFDKFFANSDRVYQILEHKKVDGDIKVSDESSGLVSDLLKIKFPEVEYAASLAPPDWFQKFTLSVGDKDIKATGQYAGKDYFNIFSFKLLEGKSNNVLADKNSIVISDELAKTLFGTTVNIIGKPIRFQHDTTFFVSGIFQKQPDHSTQQFDFVLSFEYYFSIADWVKTWGNSGPHNFVLFKKGTDVNSFNRKIAGIIGANSNDTTRSLFASKFVDNYLLHSFSHGSQTGSRIEYVKLFSFIALFILAIACINFMNLSTAKASRRLKEVGIKKVMGAYRKDLIFQFLSESVLIAFAAIIIAMVIVFLLLPQFNQLTGKKLFLSLNTNLLIAIVSITLGTGLLAGIYPAIYLSNFNPISILKNKLRTSMGEVWARKGLVVFQFAITVCLIIAVLVVYKQIRLIQSVQLGYNKENILRFNAEGKVLSNEDNFLDGLRKIPGVVNASTTTHALVGRNYGGYMVDWPGRNQNDDYYFEGIGSGYDFIETMGMKMAAGRSYSRSFGRDSGNIIFNEAAIKTMGLKDPVGKTIKWFGKNMQIIGVVQDFHFESVHEPVKPLYIALDYGATWDKVMVRLNSIDQKQTIARIQNYYEHFNPGFPFEYNFLDEAYQKQYSTDNIVSILSKYFAVLAIIISCLGLFGLAAFTAQKRQKEIGIRKIVGASAGRIYIMLSKDFLILICIAIVIAFPFSWWAMNRWLHTFAYRETIPPLVFFIAAFSVLLIALLTISIQSLKVAASNPVKSLRAE